MPNFINTETMQYDLNKHRYILQPLAIEQRYGIQLLDVLDADEDISPETLPQRYLDRLSLIIYNYMYSWSSDIDDTEYVISLSSYRPYIEEAMCELCYAWLMNNTDPSIYFTKQTLTSIEVNPAVQTILINHGLLFRGKYYNLPVNYKDTRGVDY